MTRIFQREFRCCFCSKEFVDRVIGSTNTFGGMNSELRVFARGFQPIAFRIHTCPFCGFTDDNHNERTLRAEKHKFEAFLKVDCMKKWSINFTPSEKYEVFANLLIINGDSSLHVADAYMKAAWMADDEKNEPAGQILREKALAFYLKYFKHNESYPEKTGIVTYLIGEINRRLANFEEALEWFYRWLHQSPAENQKIKALFEQQHALALKKDSSTVRIEPNMNILHL